jgi:hypothetical protein
MKRKFLTQQGGDNVDILQAVWGRSDGRPSNCFARERTGIPDEAACKNSRIFNGWRLD